MNKAEEKVVLWNKLTTLTQEFLYGIGIFEDSCFSFTKVECLLEKSKRGETSIVSSRQESFFENYFKNTGFFGTQKNFHSSLICLYFFLSFRLWCLFGIACGELPLLVSSLIWFLWHSASCADNKSWLKEVSSLFLSTELPRFSSDTNLFINKAICMTATVYVTVSDSSRYNIP